MTLYPFHFLVNFDRITLHLGENKQLCQFAQSCDISISRYKSSVNEEVIKTAIKTLDKL